MRKKSQKEISASIIRYYDSLTDEELAENRAWGVFALSQFRSIDCPEGATEDSVGEGKSEIQRRVIARRLLKD